MPGADAQNPHSTSPRRSTLSAVSYPLADGDPGVSRTIRLMQGLVDGPEGARHPDIRAAAVECTNHLEPRDYRGEMQCCFDLVKSRIRFVNEYEELLQTPLTTLQLGAGDCDDQATLLAALLRALGHEVRFVTAAADPSEPETFSHVYMEAFDRKAGQWVALDPTVRQSFVGWVPPRVTRRKAWARMGNLRPSLAGIGDDPSSTSQQILTATQPLINAAAYRLAYGNQPGFRVGFDLGTGFNQSPMGVNGNALLWMLGATAVLVFATKGRR